MRLYEDQFRAERLRKGRRDKKQLKINEDPFHMRPDEALINKLFISYLNAGPNP